MRADLEEHTIDVKDEGDDVDVAYRAQASDDRPTTTPPRSPTRKLPNLTDEFVLELEDAVRTSAIAARTAAEAFATEATKLEECMAKLRSNRKRTEKDERESGQNKQGAKGDAVSSGEGSRGA